MNVRELRRLRKAIRQVQSLRAGTATRYPETLRREVLVYVGRGRAAGESLQSIARQLGLRVQLLDLWQRKCARSRFRAVRVRPAAVVLQKPESASSLVLVTGSGMRVEGLDVAGAAALVRELS